MRIFHCNILSDTEIALHRGITINVMYGLSTHLKNELEFESYYYHSIGELLNAVRS